MAAIKKYSSRVEIPVERFLAEPDMLLHVHAYIMNEPARNGPTPIFLSAFFPIYPPGIEFLS